MALGIDHELLAELFRTAPELARVLLRECAGVELPGTRAELASVDFTQVAPVEYRADVVIAIRDDGGRVVSGVVVEIQLALDPRTRFTWPLYVAAARASLECPVTLLVITPELAVARWAALPIHLGVGTTCCPFALSFAELPRVIDDATAQAMPQLIVLSAIAHEEADTVVRAAQTIIRLGDEDSALYLDLLEDLLPPDLRSSMSDYFKNYVPRGPTARALMAEQREMGRAEGLAEGHLQGLRIALVAQIEAKFGAVSPETRTRVDGLDPVQVERALTRILTASSLDALFDDQRS